MGYTWTHNMDDLDASLDNAKHEVEFCIGGLIDLEPWAHEISKKKLSDENLVSKILTKMEADQWTEQLKGLLLEIIEAQAKYIELLERRSGK